MVRRSIFAFVVVVLAMLALAAPALAGGWAVVTLDSLPRVFAADGLRDDGRFAARIFALAALDPLHAVPGAVSAERGRREILRTGVDAVAGRDGQAVGGALDGCQ